MSGAVEERWRIAVSKQLGRLEAALNAVDAECPRTRDPWHKRAWWRVVGEPADVRVRKHLEGRKRAELFLAELALRHPTGGACTCSATMRPGEPLTVNRSRCPIHAHAGRLSR